MEQSPSWETNRFSASQEIPSILWNSKIRTAFAKAFRPSLFCPRINPVQVPVSHVLKIHFNIILPSKPGSSKVVSFPQVSPPKFCMHLSSHPYVLRSLLLFFFCPFVHYPKSKIDTVYTVKCARNQTLIIRLLRGGRYDTRILGFCNKIKYIVVFVLFTRQTLLRTFNKTLFEHPCDAVLRRT